MTLSELLQALKPLPQQAVLLFETANGRIGGGYHLTELKHAAVSSIDCGANVSNWVEARLQLLDAEGSEPMSVGKFSAILRQSIKALSGLADAPLQVEFAHSNVGLRVYEPSSPELSRNTVTIRLDDERAQCKPALAYMTAQGQSDCCGNERPATTSCCG